MYVYVCCLCMDMFISYKNSYLIYYTVRLVVGNEEEEIMLFLSYLYTSFLLDTHTCACVYKSSVVDDRSAVDEIPDYRLTHQNSSCSKQYN